MKRKQLTILLIAGVVIGAIAWWTQSQRSEAWQVGTAEEREKVFPDFAPDQVAQIGIREGDREVHLELREGRWTVREREQYPADFSQIKDLIRAIWELEPVRQIQVGPDHLGRLNLSDPEQAGSSGTQVAFRDQEGETVQTVILGKEETRERSGGPQSQFGRGGGSMPVGRFVRGLGEENQVWLVEETFSSVTPDPSRWLDSDTFFAIDRIRSIALSSEREGYNWKLQRETEHGDWELVDRESEQELDSGTLSGLSNAFSSPSFNDVLIGQTDIGTPIEATITTFDDFTYQLTIGEEMEEGDYPVRLAVSADLPEIPEAEEAGNPQEGEAETENGGDRREELKELHEKLEQEQQLEGWTYAVPSYTVNSLLKKRSELFTSEDEEETEGAQPPVPGGEGLPTTPPSSQGPQSESGPLPAPSTLAPPETDPETESEGSETEAEGSPDAGPESEPEPESEFEAEPERPSEASEEAEDSASPDEEAGNEGSEPSQEP